MNLALGADNRFGEDIAELSLPVEAAPFLGGIGPGLVDGRTGISSVDVAFKSRDDDDRPVLLTPMCPSDMGSSVIDGRTGISAVGMIIKSRDDDKRSAL